MCRLHHVRGDTSQALQMFYNLMLGLCHLADHKPTEGSGQALERRGEETIRQNFRKKWLEEHFHLVFGGHYPYEDRCIAPRAFDWWRVEISET